MKEYRQGAIGALLDIYEEAIADFIETISMIPDLVLSVNIDPNTTDVNCQSIQNILSHVVYSAYGYATSMNNCKPDKLVRPHYTFHSYVGAYIADMGAVFSYTENILNKWQDEELEQLDNSLKIVTGWGQQYDTEQLMEHAIVHVLRHHRQIEKIKIHSLFYKNAIAMAAAK